jgi:hypothetical protein
MENLCILHNEYFLVGLLAYLEDHNDHTAAYDIVVLNSNKEYFEFEDIFSELRIRFINKDLLQGKQYNSLLLFPGHGLFYYDKHIIEGVEFKNVVLAADGYQNNLLWDLNFSNNVNKVAYYFVMNEEETFDKILQSNNKAIDKQVINLETYKMVWEKIHKSLAPKLLSDHEFEASDLLVLDRYWGIGHYEIGNNKKSLIYQDLQSTDYTFDKVYFKSSPIQGFAGEEFRHYELTKFCKSKNISLIPWDDLFELKSEYEFINSPESILFLGEFENLGFLFALDSSISWLMTVVNNSTQVILPSYEIVDAIFLQKRTTNMVLERLKLFQDSTAAFFDSDKRVVSSGYDMLMIVQEINHNQMNESINSKNKLIDDLSSNYDRLMVEKSELLRQISDLNKEIEMLYNSKSFRITKPLRQIKKYFTG